MTGHEKAAENLINLRGFDITIDTVYRIASDLAVGVDEIPLSDVFGLQPGHKLILGGETVWISSVDPIAKSVNLTAVTTLGHSLGESLRWTSNTKAMSHKARSSNRDVFEPVRSIRIAKNSVVNYGSIVQMLNRSHFVTGYNVSDLSLLIKVRAIDAYVTHVRYTQNAANYNGFDYDSLPETLASNIPAYIEHISSRLDLQEAGYVKSTYQVVTVPAYYEVQIEDVLIIPAGQYKVVGFAKYNLPNMLTLITDYDNTRTEAGGIQI
jgi:hypothetical protein